MIFSKYENADQTHPLTLQDIRGCTHLPEPDHTMTVTF